MHDAEIFNSHDNRSNVIHIGYSKFKLNSKSDTNIGNSLEKSLQNALPSQPSGLSPKKNLPYNLNGPQLNYIDKLKSKDNLNLTMTPNATPPLYTWDKINDKHRTSIDLRRVLEEKNEKIRRLERELEEYKDKCEDLLRQQRNSTPHKTTTLEEMYSPYISQDLDVFHDMLGDKASPDSVRFAKMATHSKKLFSRQVELEKKIESVTKGIISVSTRE